MKQWGIVFVAFLLGASLPTTQSFADTWYVKVDGTGDVPTIQAGCDSAKDGDTVLVAAGTYTWNNQGTGNQYGLIHILRGSADMVIKSESGRDVTAISAQGQGRVIFFQGETELTIEGFTIRNGVAPLTGDFTGGGFAAHLSSPIIRDCIFRNNSADRGGAYWYGGVGAPQVTDCLFENNSASGNGGAVYLINTSLTCTFSGNTFADNTSGARGGVLFGYNVGLNMVDCFLRSNDASTAGGAVLLTNNHPSTMSGCTIVQNGAPTGGGVMCEAAGQLVVSNTLISLGTGGGGAFVDGNSTLTFSCSNIFNNAGGDWVGALTAQNGTNGNFSLDPFFCDPSTIDFTLGENSPCLPLLHPNGDQCGLIGAFGEGCGAVAIQERSWGAIKAIYSE